VRTAIAYLTSLVCHGVVLVELAHLSAWSDTPPRYSMQGGGPASVALSASLAAPNDGGDLEDTPVIVAVLPPYGQAEPEAPQPEPALAILPETKVLARAEPKVAVPDPTPGATAGLSSSAKNTVGQANRATLPQPTPAVVAHPAKPSKGRPAAAVSQEASPPPRRGTPTRHVGSGPPGSTGADAVTAAGSSGNAGGGQGDQAPSSVASNPRPPYPDDALARGIGGLVLLRVRIGADGRVEEAAVHESSGTPSLDESALSTVRRRWRFEPATHGGVPVSCEWLVPIRFTFRAG
jgi:periplasmic protein TonB